jgi:glyoxylase-like metal-dependent hydrolase (beta-lactamase superfamily II)
VNEISPGLWRWTAPHPAWVPNATPDSSADWEQHVGSVLYVSQRTAVFFDPLLPADVGTFWTWADSRVAGRAVTVLTTIRWHRRSRIAFAKRYAASVSRAKRNLPPGVDAFVVRGAGETIYWLPEHRALIPGDRILGSPSGGLRLCPESWLRYLPSRMTLAELRSGLRPLLELPVERVLVSHGEPVLRNGAEALAQALADR